MKVYSCDSNLKAYSIECAHQDQFNKLSAEFKTLKLEPLKFKGYIVPLIIGSKKFDANKNGYLNHSIETLSTNRDWNIWKKSEALVSKLNPVSINLSDVTKLHFHLLSTGSLSDYLNANLGKLRTSNAAINPTIDFSCEDEQIDKEVVDLFKNYDLTTDEGYSLLTMDNIIDCRGAKNRKSGKIIFYKNASMQNELNRWIVDFNDTISRFSKSETLDVSPYQYLADMRRWFMAISPFSEGNQNIAEALLHYATHRLNLPPLTQTNRRIPILLTVEENRDQVMKQMAASLVFFENCLFEIKAGPISEECKVVQ